MGTPTQHCLTDRHPHPALKDPPPLALTDPPALTDPRFSPQTLLCINPPLFEVYQTLLSPTQHHVALVGTRGLTVLELPKRWGKSSEFEGGKETVNCRWVGAGWQHAAGRAQL